MNHPFVTGLVSELDSEQCNSQSKSLISIFYSFYGHKIFQVKFLFVYFKKYFGHFLAFKIIFYSICFHIPSVHFNSVAQSCPSGRLVMLCDPMNHRTLGLPVHHQLPEPTQTHAHWVSDAIQPSHPLSSHSHPALNLSQ